MLVDLGIDAGLGSGKRIDLCESRWRVRAEMMEGDERKSSSKKRPKQIDVGLDSGDDEPIGSLLKMKKPRNPKKAKAGLEKGLGKGKKEEVEDEGLGGMNDTLASLWKKLKVSKKDLVSGSGDSDEKSAARVMEKDLALSNGGSDLTSEIRAENKPKGKSKRPKSNLNAKSNSNGGGLESIGSGISLAKDKSISGVKGEEDTRHHSSDDRLEDSLSSLIRRAQLGLAKKCRANSAVKEDNEMGRGQANDKEQDHPLHQRLTVREGLEIDPCSLGKVYDFDIEPCTSLQHVDNSLSPGQKSALKNYIIKGVKQHPTDHEISSLNHEDDLQNEIPNECSYGPHHVQPCVSPSSNSQNIIESCTNRAGLNTNVDRVHLSSGPLAAEALGNQLENNQTALKSTNVQSEGRISGGEETLGDSPPSGSPDEEECFLEDTASIPNSGSKEKRLSASRETRKPKKRRHRDMAYEGDADWEKLVHDQAFQDKQHALDSDRLRGLRLKFETEGGGVAAVSAGLKARAVGPVERIKFKEVLKRRGGLLDYLECRNYILGLWNKDVSRILPLSDCGVSEPASANESVHASFIREIYAFLDQSGYINFGIASEKDEAQVGSKQHYKLREKIFSEGSGVSVADSEDGVSFITGQINNTKAMAEAKDGVISNAEIQTQEVAKVTDSVKNEPLEPNNVVEPEGSCGDIENCSIDAKLIGKLASIDEGSTDPSLKTLEVGQAPIIPSEVKDESCHIQSAANDNGMRINHLQCGTDSQKKIIVIGAGPAGLTAARHLQRQGFSVTILEARHRIGGRVYTDRSSLSVPVDLGASIITGVEADVDTERRPDPSALICAQLGLELSILKSDCPLYDTVTAQKVPPDLDEALEAEYNSLLDDMILLVAQKGEHAMKMSLEEGLEYALEKRRRARLGMITEEKQQNSATEGFVDCEAISGGGAPLKNGSSDELMSPLERRVMDWHFANLEYGCAALLKEVSLPYWNQDDVYGGFGGAHCMIKGGYSAVVESLVEGLHVNLNHVVTDVSYNTKVSGDGQSNNVRVATSNGSEFLGDAVLVTVPLGCLKAETIRFSPPLPQWKHSSVQRLGFGVLNKVVMEFPDVFWDDSVDYFGATAEETDLRGQCFMFWNLKKTVGAPVLIALLVGKAAIEGQIKSSSDHVNHALVVLRKLFGERSVPDPLASVVTDWGRDPYSYGAYSYVAIGASGEDYDILGRPVENCLFFAGEATCKEHPDTVGGAIMSGLREAVRIIDILTTGNDYTAEVEAMEAVLRQSVSERDEVRDIARRLDAVELSNVLNKNSLDGTKMLTMDALLQELFFNTKTNAARLHLVKELLHLHTETLKSFAGTKEGLSTLNSWILDSMGKDGTQLLRHCVRLLVLVSTDLLAVRLSGIGKTVKEKVCVHTSRDIRAIASQLVNVWLEVFRKEKASMKYSRHSALLDVSKRKSCKDTSGKPPLHTNYGALENRGNLPVSASNGVKKVNGKVVKPESAWDVEDAMTEEEKAAIAAAEAAQAAALAAAEAYASSEAKSNTLLQLPKIPSFHKFVKREHVQPEEYDHGKKWPGSAFGRPDCTSEIDSRNCRVRDWSVDFSATCINLDDARATADNVSQRSHSNDITSQMNFREHSGESAAVDSSFYTKAWVDSAGSEGLKDHHAIERWQSQAAAAADSSFFYPAENIRDEEDSNASSRQPTWKYDGRANESSVSHITKESVKGHHRGAERIKQAVVDYVASLLMPLYKAKKIDKEGYKSIMKKSATKVMEQATDAEKAMAVSQFLDFKRKNKIRAFVDKLIERHMASKPTVNHKGPDH